MFQRLPRRIPLLFRLCLLGLFGHVILAARGDVRGVPSLHRPQPDQATHDRHLIGNRSLLLDHGDLAIGPLERFVEGSNLLLAGSIRRHRGGCRRR